ncbi:MAG: integrase/recombinase XerD [Myxococcota bacterium]|jgi:integrase/recombinase XerD
MEANGLRVGAMVPRRLEEFMAARRAAGYTTRRTVRSLRPIVAMLGACGVTFPPGKPVVLTSQARLCADYAVFLATERGLADATVKARQTSAADVLRVCFGDAEPVLRDLSAGDVIGYMQHVVRAAGTVRTAALSAANTRSFLRWLHLRGDTPTDLSGAVPAVASYRQTGLPGDALSPEEIERVLGTADRSQTTGRRDYALLTLFIRLGLRRAEVAAMTLDDLDWERGELCVHGKGKMLAKLPIPPDVGEALADWLRVRPTVTTRAVFVTSRAPIRPLPAGGVGSRANSALRRAGITSGGAHRLRRTAATRMLNAGGSRTEIAQVLRHDAIDTTAIYAKVDMKALDDLAQPWPGGAA